MTKILFVNHKKSQCGVYEFGRNVGDALKLSSLEFSYHECGSGDELREIATQQTPDAIIYNYHPATMRWLSAGITRNIRCPQIGIIHEVTQTVADRANNSLFNFHIAHDPTLLLKNPIVFKAGRLIPQYENKFTEPEIPVIGSFGFAGKKGQRRLVELVQKEFDEAVIRINIPFATFGDARGKMAMAIAEECRAALTKPNIKLELTHDFLAQKELLDFIAQNTINLFLYEPMDDEHRGISGVVDLALAVNRPVGITQQKMFRHIESAFPKICIENNSVKEIVNNGTRPLERFYGEWSAENLCWDYKRIVANVFSRKDIPKIANPLISRTKRFIKRKLRIPDANSQPVWITGDVTATAMRATYNTSSYKPADIPHERPLNNILDDEARELYRETIAQMFEFLPELMSRKIAEANVQQAFVLDTVYKFASEISEPKILCVGSFEDSASASLKLLGVETDEIDPMINYDLATFLTKPTTKLNSYDIILSTSVIEHVEHDEEFVTQIASLLQIGGKAVLTCDFNDNFKPGDPKPVVDHRLYTQKDIRERLMSRIPNCRLVDEPLWNCPNPDFWFEGVNYTFASIVLEKTK